MHRCITHLHPSMASATQAIFGDEFHLISEAPPRFTIKLRKPGAGSDSDDGGSSGAAGPPSRLFTLVLQLPKVGWGMMLCILRQTSSVACFNAGAAGHRGAPTIIKLLHQYTHVGSAPCAGGALQWPAAPAYR